MSCRPSSWSTNRNSVLLRFCTFLTDPSGIWATTKQIFPESSIINTVMTEECSMKQSLKGNAAFLLNSEKEIQGSFFTNHKPEGKNNLWENVVAYKWQSLSSYHTWVHLLWSSAGFQRCTKEFNVYSDSCSTSSVSRRFDSRTAARTAHHEPEEWCYSWKRGHILHPWVHFWCHSTHQT